MNVPPLVVSPLGPALENVPAHPLLILGPSLGTSAATLWTEVAELLAGRFDCFGFDLPGHGLSRSVPPVSSMEHLAKAMLRGVGGLQAKRGEVDTPFLYAGVSVSGCIGLQVLLDAPQRLRAAAIINSAYRIGQPAAWADRAGLVMRQGTDALRASSSDRWFGAGFGERNPARASALLDSLGQTRREGYAGVCRALAGFDAQDRAPGITRPVLVIGGDQDVATPSKQQKDLVEAIPGSRIAVLSGVGHLAPAETPEIVAGLLADFFTSAC